MTRAADEPCTSLKTVLTVGCMQCTAVTAVNRRCCSSGALASNWQMVSHAQHPGPAAVACLQALVCLEVPAWKVWHAWGPCMHKLTGLLGLPNVPQDHPETSRCRLEGSPGHHCPNPRCACALQSSHPQRPAQPQCGSRCQTLYRLIASEVQFPSAHLASPPDQTKKDAFMTCPTTFNPNGKAGSTWLQFTAVW